MLLCVALMAALALAATGVAPSVVGLLFVPTLTVLLAGWLLCQLVRLVHLKTAPPDCGAWDAAGRPLRIEMI